MESVFLWCAGLGGTVIGCQLLASLVGLGSDHDADAGDDADAGGHDEAGWFFGLLTIRTAAAGLAFFGLGGLSALSAGVDGPPAVAFAAFCGSGAVMLVAKIMATFKRLQHDGSVDIEAAVGAVGTAYLRVPAANAGPGKVTLTLQGRTVECEAFTPAAEIATGQPVRVVAVLGPNAVEVEPLSGVAS
jgi:hypothetical protein